MFNNKKPVLRWGEFVYERVRADYVCLCQQVMRQGMPDRFFPNV